MTIGIAFKILKTVGGREAGNRKKVKQARNKTIRKKHTFAYNYLHSKTMRPNFQSS